MHKVLPVLAALSLTACDWFGSNDSFPSTQNQGGAPIVLAHGFFGFETFAGLDFETYFYGVKDALQQADETEVFTPAVDPFNDSETRGQELLAAVEQILAETGASQVNLIGHSQGGLDARYVASLRPDLVASLTTISTPHTGSPLADVVTGLLPYPGLQDVTDAVVRFVGAPLWDASGQQTSLFRALDQLSSRGTAQFNARYPLSPSLPIYSLAGRSSLSSGGSECVAASSPAFVSQWDSYVDVLDPLFLLFSPIMAGNLLSPAPNDGLVRVADAKLGTFLGCIPADHTDEIGQILGDIPGPFNAFDHKQFYVGLVTWLRSQGF